MQLLFHPQLHLSLIPIVSPFTPFNIKHPYVLLLQWGESVRTHAPPAQRQGGRRQVYILFIVVYYHVDFTTIQQFTLWCTYWFYNYRCMFYVHHLPTVPRAWVSRRARKGASATLPASLPSVRVYDVVCTLCYGSRSLHAFPLFLLTDVLFYLTCTSFDYLYTYNIYYIYICNTGKVLSAKEKLSSKSGKDAKTLGKVRNALLVWWHYF
jgi:hypothetical protein